MTKCLGHNQLELTILALTDRDKFLEHAAEHFRLRCHLTTARLISRRSGRVVALNHLDRIKSMKSLYSFNGLLEVGEYCRETVDLDSVPGTIHLADEDRDLIDTDYREIRKLEDDGIVAVAS
jgi:3-phosphoglycerate kinase